MAIRSKLLHPDKSTNAEGPFLVVRHAYQVLLNPLSRKVYDLFGPTVVQWELKTERDYLLRGVGWTVLPGYVITFIALQVYGLFGRGGQVKYVFPSTELCWVNL
jgi:curved DNA-binding protein CbpA